MTTLRILGPLEAWHGEQRLALGGPRQVTLLAFLVIHANRAVSRDTVIDAVWGPARSDADNRLQMAIARLRKALEPSAGAGRERRLQTLRGGYLLSVAPGELDADLFQSGVHAGTRELDGGDPARAVALLQEALSLWRGPPLADVAFEDFAQAEIRRLEELHFRAVECRVDAELALGRHTELIGELEGLLVEAPTREHLAGQLMRALYRSGRQADALEVYQRVRAALVGELGLEPGPALKTLHLEILEQADSLSMPSGRASGAARVPASGARAPVPVRLRPYGPSVFAGRRRELDGLARMLRAASDGDRAAVFVTGEPGIGKTRLVSEFAHEAHASGALVSGGRCDDGLSLPYQPFVEALEHVIAHAPAELLERHVAEYGPSIARLVPALGRYVHEQPAAAAVTSDSERFVLFRAIEGLLAALCDPGPALLVLEDLHWADVPTLELLRRLLSAPRTWALVFLVTCRVEGLADDHPLREMLADLHREPRALRLDLIGLESPDVAELLRGIEEAPSGEPDPELIDALGANTNGNPFFITELVRSLADLGALASDHGRLRLSEGVRITDSLPLSISETLAQRLRRVERDVRRCLEVGAVLGEEFDLELVAEVSGITTSPDALARAVDDALLIEVPGQRGRFRFAHALMQRYLYRELGPVRQTRLHHQVALAMEGQTVRIGHAELARHWMEAVDSDVGTAVGYSMLAGDEALGKLAPDEARRWYQASLELLDRGRGPRDGERCELLIRRGGAERQAGDRRFRETLLEAAEIAQRIGDEAALVRAVLGNTRGMQSETGIVDEPRIAMLDRALGIIGDGDSQKRARLLAMHAAELAYSGEWERRVRLSDEALAVARRLDDPDSLSTVLNMRFVTLLAPETLTERQANAAEAVAVAERLNDPLARFYAYHWRAYAYIEAGDALAARMWVSREEDIADRFRQPTTVWLTQADRANLAIIAGRLDVADQLSSEALETGRRSEPDAFACYAAQQTSIAFERGGLETLVPVLQQAVRENPGVPGFRAPLALALTAASRAREARTILEAATESGFLDVPHDVTWLAVGCIYACVSATLEDSSSAALLYRVLEPYGEQIAFPAFGVWGPVDLYLGSLAVVLREFDAAQRHLRRAARAAARAGAPRWEAHAAGRLEQLAEIVR